jgi:hypothetical protein
MPGEGEGKLTAHDVQIDRHVPAVDTSAVPDLQLQLRRRRLRTAWLAMPGMQSVQELQRLLDLLQGAEESQVVLLPQNALDRAESLVPRVRQSIRTVAA